MRCSQGPDRRPGACVVRVQGLALAVPLLLSDCPGTQEPVWSGKQSPSWFWRAVWHTCPLDPCRWHHAESLLWSPETLQTPELGGHLQSSHRHWKVETLVLRLWSVCVVLAIVMLVGFGYSLTMLVNCIATTSNYRLSEAETSSTDFVAGREVYLFTFDLNLACHIPLTMWGR